MEDTPERTVRQLGPLTKELIDGVLSPFIGLPFTGFYKPVFAIFEFGEQRSDKNRRGEDVTFADWSIEISCSWQVTKGDIVVLGSGDMRWTGKRKRRFFTRKTPPRDLRERLRWKAANDFFDRSDEGNLTVLSVSGGPAGAVSIELSDGFAIRAFNADSGFYDLWTVRHRPTDYSFWADLRSEGLVAYEIEPA